MYLLLLVHIYFLYKVWTGVGILWCLGCIVFPPLALFVFYREWAELRGIFFAELVLIVARLLVS